MDWFPKLADKWNGIDIIPGEPLEIFAKATEQVGCLTDLKQDLDLRFQVQYIRNFILMN